MSFIPIVESRSRSQSEQPATCPICYAVIRQSRNLRRHLELRHFAKPGVKKEKKSKSGGNDTELNSTAESGSVIASNVSDITATACDSYQAVAGNVTAVSTSNAPIIVTHGNSAGGATVTHMATLKQEQPNAATSSSGTSLQNVIHFVSEEVFGS